VIVQRGTFCLSPFSKYEKIQALNLTLASTKIVKFRLLAAEVDFLHNMKLSIDFYKF